MKKVLFVIESLSGGGAEKVLATLIDHFDHTQYDLTVCSIVDVGKYNEAVKKKAHYCYVIPSTEGKSFFYRVWASIKYKLFYYWLPVQLAYKLFMPKGFDTEVAFIEGFVTKIMSHSKAYKVAWVHCDLKEYPWPVNTGIYSSLDDERKTYAKYHKIVAVSKSAARHFSEIYGLAERTIYIYNPIDKTDILAKASEAPKKEAHKLRFITIGRLMEAKGIDRLIEACHKLKLENHNFELWILGEGSDREKLTQQVENCGLTPMVKFFGFQANPYKYLAQSDCFVCSSRTEGYSLVIAEALCCGLPVISTNCTGPEEILEGGKWGLLVENSTVGIYNGMKRVFKGNHLTELKNLSHTRSLSFNIEASMLEVEKIV